MDFVETETVVVPHKQPCSLFSGISATPVFYAKIVHYCR